MHDRSSPHRIANSLGASSLLTCTCALLLATSAPAQSGEEGSVNTGTTTNTPLNPGTPGVPGRSVARLLSAPRIDPSVTFNLNELEASVPIAAHLRDHAVDENGLDLGDYRERIFLFEADAGGGGGFVGAIDEGRSVMVPDAQGTLVERFLGGNAYESSALFGDLNSADPYMTDSFSSPFYGELNTFGGLTINGGRIAFFSGVVTEAQELNETDRSAPPSKASDSPTLDAPWKPDIQNRGVWVATPDPGAEGDLSLDLLAFEGQPSPIDPDRDRSFQEGGIGDEFRRLHPSDYGPAAFNSLDPIVGSWFGEQRFSRIANIAMNQAGQLAFRGDIGSGPTDPILGVWAEQLEAGGTKSLHRVFVDDTVAIDMDNSFSLDPYPKYSVLSLGAPAISDNAAAPLVASYALVQGTDGSGDFASPAMAIITRRPGEDPNDPIGEQDGFATRILAVEGEAFTAPGEPDPFILKLSALRDPGSDNPLTRDGLPGLADLPGQLNDTREYFKDAAPLVNKLSLSAFHPRPSVNSNNNAVYMGTIGATVDSSGDLVLPASDPLAPFVDNSDIANDLVRDEAIWSTREAAFGVHRELVVQEGDEAPVIVNGQALPNTRFAAFGVNPFSTSEDLANRQAFYRPLINDQDEIVFIGTWVSDEDGDPATTGDVQFGRGIFLSRGPGQLECLVSSGELTRETFDVPGSSTNVQGVLTDDFCRVATPIGLSPGARSFEQVGWTDSGILSFTTRMERADTGDDLGWGVFVYNTAEPTGANFDPRGPQLVVKTRGGPIDVSDEFSFPGIPDITIDGEARYHTGVSVAYGESSGGDANLHPQGMLAFGVNPDAGEQLGMIVAATPDPQSLDWDGDGVVDGLDNCPVTFNPSQADADGDGIGDACETGGGGGECTDCRLCVEIDCEFNGLLLGDGPDFDQSGTVDDTDVELMMMAWGYTKGRFDLNKDSIVDVLDLEILMQDYGKKVE